MNTVNPDINIYECPETPTLEYMVAVMQAALDGKPVQFAQPDDGWRTATNAETDLSWDWFNNKYQIARPALADGHNPDGLTEDMVGKGWRLLTTEEVYNQDKYILDMQCWDGAWFSAVGGSHPGSTYRTKRPKGWFLPKPAQLCMVSDDGGKTWRMK